mmetsp:Transcript_72050/g.234188  ORF Transcript_72050/g.234188 Transcript_72050/m.234188 type:complete len:254 (-) Transcript_72050:325-1086(-)
MMQHLTRCDPKGTTDGNTTTRPLKYCLSITTFPMNIVRSKSLTFFGICSSASRANSATLASQESKGFLRSPGSGTSIFRVFSSSATFSSAGRCCSDISSIASKTFLDSPRSKSFAPARAWSTCSIAMSNCSSNLERTDVARAFKVKAKPTLLATAVATAATAGPSPASAAATTRANDEIAARRGALSWHTRFERCFWACLRPPCARNVRAATFPCICSMPPWASASSNRSPPASLAMPAPPTSTSGKSCTCAV